MVVVTVETQFWHFKLDPSYSTGIVSANDTCC